MKKEHVDSWTAPCDVKGAGQAMKTLNVGIVGAGRIGNVHAQSITYHIPQARVVRVTM